MVRHHPRRASKRRSARSRIAIGWVRGEITEPQGIDAQAESGFPLVLTADTVTKLECRWEGCAADSSPPDRAGSVPMRVEMSGITKRFAGVEALSGIDLTVEHGSVLGLVGENGAGKSTLGKILAGVIQPDEGEITLNGHGKVRWRTPRDALAAGITIIAQELTLEPRRSIAENVLLGIEPKRRGLIDRKALNADCAELAEKVGFEDLAAMPEALWARCGCPTNKRLRFCGHSPGALS